MKNTFHALHKSERGELCRVVLLKKWTNILLARSSCPADDNKQLSATATHTHTRVVGLLTQVERRQSQSPVTNNQLCSRVHPTVSVTRQQYNCEMHNASQTWQSFVQFSVRGWRRFMSLLRPMMMLEQHRWRTCLRNVLWWRQQR